MQGVFLFVIHSLVVLRREGSQMEYASLNLFIKNERLNLLSYWKHISILCVLQDGFCDFTFFSRSLHSCFLN